MAFSNHKLPLSPAAREDIEVLRRLKSRLKTDKMAIRNVLIDAHIVTKTGRLTAVYTGKR